MESRYTDEAPVQCEDCGWQGLVSECKHHYSGYYSRSCQTNELMSDVEPADFCPECGSENLIEILPDNAELVPA